MSYIITGEISSQEPFCEDTLLNDEITNALEKGPEVIETSEFGRHANSVDQLSQKDHETCESDSEYESFGETIDANDNFDYSDAAPMIEHNNTSSNCEKKKTNLVQSLPSERIERKEENTLSNYVLNLNKAVKSPSGKSLESLSSMNSYEAVKINKRKPNSVKDANEVAEKDSDGKTDNMSHKYPKRQKSTSSAASGSSQADCYKRAEVKRETWVTKSKISVEREKREKSPSEAMPEAVSREAKQPHTRLSTEYLNHHVNTIKNLQVRLKRLTTDTLSQYDCSISSPASSQCSQSPARRRNGKASYVSHTKSRNSNRKLDESISSYLNRSKQRNDDGFVNNANVNNKIATWQRNKNYSTIFLEGINSADASHKKGGSKKSHSCSSKTKRGKSLSLRSSLRQNSYQSSISSSSSESEHEEIQSTKGMLKANYMPNRVFET